MGHWLRWQVAVWLPCHLSSLPCGIGVARQPLLSLGGRAPGGRAAAPASRVRSLPSGAALCHALGRGAVPAYAFARGPRGCGAGRPTPGLCWPSLLERGAVPPARPARTARGVFEVTGSAPLYWLWLGWLPARGGTLGGPHASSALINDLVVYRVRGDDMSRGMRPLGGRGRCTRV